MQRREQALGHHAWRAGLLDQREERIERSRVALRHECIERLPACFERGICVGELLAHLIKRAAASEDHRERLRMLAHIRIGAILQLRIDLHPAFRLRDAAKTAVARTAMGRKRGMRFMPF